MEKGWATLGNVVLPKNVLERVCLVVATLPTLRCRHACLIITDAGTEDHQIEP